jgi:hypothetical protein
MKRLKKHKPKQYENAAALLDSGSMPSLVFGDHAHAKGVNPAILYMLHASGDRLPSASTSQPVSSRTSTCGSGPRDTDNLTQRHPTAEGYKAAVGEVWWLFDSGRPYLAEVFRSGTVPEGRLPHVDKRSTQGRTIARVLGKTSQFIEIVAPSARTYMFSTGYDF